VSAVLAINPNTTASITALVENHARAAAPEIEWRMATGRFGARYITSEAGYAISAHAALEAWAKHGAGCDAVLLACFGDPGLHALRELSPVPVVGLAEASMRAAAREAARFSIVTGGARWGPMLERLAQALGFESKLASVRTIALTGGQVAADPDAALALLVEECKSAKREDGAGAVILGGAGFAGLAARVAPLAGFAVIDSVLAGARAAAALARGAAWPYPRPAAGAIIDSVALDGALAAKLIS
jgi:Asp/Glu/hydantoin racemase